MNLSVEVDMNRYRRQILSSRGRKKHALHEPTDPAKFELRAIKSCYLFLFLIFFLGLSMYR